MSNPSPPATAGDAPAAAADTKAEPYDNEVTHVESNTKAVNFVTDNSHEVPNDANWTFWQTVRYYWRAMAISFACGICAMGDGYQYKMPGNIVALKGFIRQMGYFDTKKNAYVLDSQQVAAWGGKCLEAFAPINRVGSIINR